MPTRLFVAMVIIIAAPLVLLARMSVDNIRRRDDLLWDQRVQLTAERLDRIDEQIIRHIETMRQPADAVVSDLRVPVDTTRLRDTRRRLAIVRQWIVVSPDGRVVYPTPPPLGDRAGVGRYESLRAMAKSRPRTNDKNVPVGKLSTSSGFGEPVWQTWFRDEGLQLAYWYRGDDGTAIGVLLERSAWIAGLIATDFGIGSNGQMRLRKSALGGGRDIPVVWSDADGSPLHVVGTTAIGDDWTVAASRDLSMPLGSMRIAGWSPPMTRRVTAALLSSAPLILLASLLLAVGAYAATATRRQMRLAVSRVSFAGLVSHELRTPLTNIRLYTELAQQTLHHRDSGASRCDDVDHDALAARLGVIDEEAKRLGRLVSGVTELIRDRDGVPPRRTRVNLASATADIVGGFDDAFERDGVRLRFDNHADGMGHLDVELYEIMLSNLISNLLKYASGGGVASIATHIDGDRLIVTVSDRGPGIGRRHRRRVFRPYVRLDSATHQPSGTGIGLAITRSAARRHGGDVTCGSTDPGDPKSGTRFTVTLDCGAITSDNTRFDESEELE